MSTTDYLLNPAIYDRVLDGVLERVNTMVLDLIDAMQDDKGRVAGQVPLRREDRILWTLDLIQSGAMGFLQVINPGVHDDLMRDYRRDLHTSGIEVPV